MNATNGPITISSPIEDIIARIARENDAALCEMAKANGQAVIDLAMRLGEARRELTEARIEVTRLNGECELLREDLQLAREREGLFMAAAGGEA